MRSVLFIFLLCFVSMVSSQSKIEATLLSTNPSIKDYLVIFHNQDAVHTETIHGKNLKAAIVIETLKNAAQKSQAGITQYLNKHHIPYEPFYLVNAMRIRSSIDVMQEIAKRTEVRSIVRNIHIQVEKIEEERSVSNGRDPEPEWGIKKIAADSVWKMGYTGQGVIVGGQDTGYDWKVNPLKLKYRGYINDSTAIHDYNWHDAIHMVSPLSGDSLNPCGFNVKEPCDDNNHGTHTMGTMVGSDSLNSIGVAPGAQWMACRNMERGNGQLSTYLECFEWFVAPTDLNGENPDLTKSPHVINNSWFCSENEGCNLSNWEPLQIAVRNLKAAGIVVIVSAGNSGPDCHTIASPPALFDPSFTIGATAINDTIASFSSRGPVTIDSTFRIKPDVSAPGRGVRSVINGGLFANFSGTSMAGPHAAGLVALMLSANPSLIGEVEIIEEIIRNSADIKFTNQECDGISGQLHPNPIYGYGRINALSAVEMALKTTVAVHDISSEKVWEIFPNPTTDFLMIKRKKYSTDLYHFSLFSAEGLKVKSIDFHHIITIDFQSLPNQMYFYTIKGPDGAVSGKILKQ